MSPSVSFSLSISPSLTHTLSLPLSHSLPFSSYLSFILSLHCLPPFLSPYCSVTLFSVSIWERRICYWGETARASKLRQLVSTLIMSVRSPSPPCQHFSVLKKKLHFLVKCWPIFYFWILLNLNTTAPYIRPLIICFFVSLSLSLSTSLSLSLPLLPPVPPPIGLPLS